jgi:hypothetical protein
MRDGKTSVALKRLNLAKRYLENAREILKKAWVDRRREAVYLSALEAIKALLILHLDLDEDFIQYIGKGRDYVQGLLKDAYDILHPIDAGFEAVEKIIKFVESYLYA